MTQFRERTDQPSAATPAATAAPGNEPAPSPAAGEPQQRIQQLEQELAALKEYKAELEKKQYIDTSLSEFSEVMRLTVDTTLERWADRLLDQLVPYVQGLQGALYLVNEGPATGATTTAPQAEAAGPYPEGHSYHLRRIGGYALTDQAPERMPLGERLPGQAAKSGERIYKEGLGALEAPTRSSTTEVDAQVLLELPLSYNKEVVGVLELTALQPFSPTHEELLNRLAEHAAANMQTLRNQEHIKQLYQQAQERQETLQAQEEEMRQNVEELEATQEEMKRVEREREEQTRSLQMAQRLANISAWWLDLNQMIFTFSEEFLETIGLAPQEDGSRQFSAQYYLDNVIVQEDRPVIENAMQRAMAAPDDTFSDRIRFRYVHQQTGEVGSMSAMIRISVDEAGQPAMAYGAVQEISAWREQERELTLKDSIFENSRDALGVMEDGVFLEVNQAYAELFGAARPEDVIGTTPDRYSPAHQPDGRPSAEAAEREIQQAVAKGSHLFEWRHQKLTGEEFDAEVFICTITFEGKTLLQSNIRDITARKQHEAELEQKRAIVENSRDAIGLMEGPYFVEVNQAYAEIFGARSPAEIIGTTPDRYSPAYQPDGRPSGEAAQAEIQQAIDHGSHTFEWRHLKLTGQEFDAEVFICTIEYEGRTLLQTNVRDITERKEREREIRQANDELQATEEELRQNMEELEATQEEMKRAQQEAAASHKRIQRFMDSIGIGVFVLQADGTPFYANQAARELLGRGIAGDGDNLAEVYDVRKAGTNESYPQAEMPIVRALYGEHCSTDDMILARPEGDRRLYVEARPILDSNGELSYAIATFQDITAEQARAEAGSLTRQLLEQLPQRVWLLQANGEGYLLADCNAAGLACLGAASVADVAGRPVHELLAPADAGDEAPATQLNQRLAATAPDQGDSLFVQLQPLAGEPTQATLHLRQFQHQGQSYWLALVDADPA
jgi:PAS domain S-box-containing protein